MGAHAGKSPLGRRFALDDSPLMHEGRRRGTGVEAPGGDPGSSPDGRGRRTAARRPAAGGIRGGRSCFNARASLPAALPSVRALGGARPSSVSPFDTLCYPFGGEPDAPGGRACGEDACGALGSHAGSSAVGIFRWRSLGNKQLWFARFVRSSRVYRWRGCRRATPVAWMLSRYSRSPDAVAPNLSARSGRGARIEYVWRTRGRAQADRRRQLR